ncbi:TPA: cell envelope integrity protein CreD [Stenotrophomonas maltophilia]|jgi:inner membrane protein|uniref:cell envelope integrity protein CreD n=1 Tax=Stenotrophomonas TaxID=40323 RepID=UPI0013104C4C|nr:MULTISPECIES: cell envelope integrity protein CreD [Stenotrophomonas]MDH2024725.1 cell envelope integrity protein CreD [Stenotrophomonas sp. GD03680]HEL3751379.1 cell envelope integrity protein CreD [Stenotrophomonas maltophilia]HEL7729536.1 cell envelope integrity protein CreD [Stenotrophomonas maltophilia]
MKSLKMLLRFAIVGGLILLLLIPLMMIRSVINERSQYRDEAFARVADSRAGAQQLVGPVRVVPWVERQQVEVVDAKGNKKTEVQVSEGHWLQMPASLDVGGEMLPSQREVGLFKVPVYSWNGQLKASFAADDYPVKPGRTYGQPYVALGVSDARGLVGTPNLRVDGRQVRLLPGVGAAAELGRGLHAPVAGFAAVQGGLLAASTVELELRLDGSRMLSVVPVADDNRIALRSRWPHPSFAGAFLPNERRVDAQGFDARWAVSSLASDAQRQLRGDGEVASQAVSVSLVDPVDAYTQADRASKYGVLFVLLTFVGFILFELIKSLRIHPLQYLMVGLALAIFFLLLISLSEHIAFWKAYLVSAAACIGLQAVYLANVLGHWKRGLGFAALLTVLYGALYGLLVSENNALLMGSLLLFVILALAMWVTRRVDWYALGAEAK